MLHLYLIQDGMETDVTAQSDITCTSAATLRLTCDPGDAIGRAFVRAANMSINRSLTGDQIAAGMMLGNAADFSSGLRVSAMYTDGKPNTNLRINVHVDASAAPVPAPVPTPVKPDPTDYTDFIKPNPRSWGSTEPVPPAPVVPAADSAELALLKAENERLSAQLSEALAQKAELANELAAQKAAAATSTDAERRIELLEKALEEAKAAAGLTGSAEALTREVQAIRRKVEELKNTRYELEMDDLPTAQDALTQLETEVSALREKALQQDAELESLRGKVQAKEAELADLQARHTDAERALTELHQLRDQLGMQDAERIALEQQLAQVQAELAKKTAELDAAAAALADAETKLNELNEAIMRIQEKIDVQSACREELNEKLRALDRELRTLEEIQKNKAQEWEKKVHALSSILADVLQTQLDLRATYELLTIAINDELFTSRGEEAAQQKRALEECGDRLREINDWVRNIKAIQAQNS